jgi:hypothetical protein
MVDTSLCMKKVSEISRIIQLLLQTQVAGPTCPLADSTLPQSNVNQYDQRGADVGSSA